MRSLLPFEVVMVPVPDQEPDIAVNGLEKACTVLGSAANPRRAAAAATVRPDFILLVKALLEETCSARPSFGFPNQ